MITRKGRFFLSGTTCYPESYGEGSSTSSGAHLHSGLLKLWDKEREGSWETKKESTEGERNTCAACRKEVILDPSLENASRLTLARVESDQYHAEGAAPKFWARQKEASTSQAVSGDEATGIG